MSSLWNVMFGGGLLVIWIIAGGFVTSAEIKIKPDRNQDGHLNAAYVQSFWAAFATWFTVALMILLLALSIFGFVTLFGSGAGEALEGAEVAEEEESAWEGYSSTKESKKSTTGETVTRLFLAAAIGLTATTGILSAIAASNLTKSDEFKPKGKTDKDKRLVAAHEKLTIAASLSLTAVGLLIIGFIAHFVWMAHKKQKLKEQINKQADTEIQLQDLRRQKALAALS